MAEKTWTDWNREKEPEPDEPKPLSSTPSSQVVPHFSEPKPQWELSDEEFWEAQVQGQLHLLHERNTGKKIEFVRRHPSHKPNLPPTFTPEQRAWAEAETRRLRLEEKIPSSFAAFKKNHLPFATYREFLAYRRSQPKTPPPPPQMPPEDDCPF